ncbi:MAG: hypothetical protein WAS36_01810 [Candidatus Saccharimonadales bacterium]
MSNISPEHTSGILLGSNAEHTLDLFQNAYEANDGSIIVPEIRVQLDGYSSPGTIRVNLATHRPISPLELLGSRFDELSARGDLLEPAEKRDLLTTFGPKGPEHAYARNLLFPFNEPGFEFRTPQNTAGNYVRFGLDIEWDDSSPVEVEVGLRIETELIAAGKNISDPAVIDDLIARTQREIAQLNLPFVDRRAGEQPILLKMGNFVLGSLPDQEGWTMQQGYANLAQYENFGGYNVVGAYYDKLTDGAPDLPGFIGATVLVPYDINLLRSTRLGFVESGQPSVEGAINLLSLGKSTV